MAEDISRARPTDTVSPPMSVGRRAIDLTPSTYMQVVGIVQSLAITYLLTVRGEPLRDYLYPLLTGRGTLDATGALFLWQFAAVFLVIVLTWHVNIQNQMAFKLRTGFLDSLIPFSFAVPEYLLIQTCEPTGHFADWCLSLAIYTGAAVIAYLHLFWWGSLKGPEHKRGDQAAKQFRGPRHNIEVLELIPGFRWVAVAYILVVMMAASYCALIGPPRFLAIGWASQSSEWQRVFTAAALFALVAGFAALHLFAFWRQVLKHKPTRS